MLRRSFQHYFKVRDKYFVFHLKQSMDFISKDVQGLPDVLQGIVMEYFRCGVYQWYRDLLDDFKATGSLENLTSLPEEVFFGYFKILLEDNQEDAIIPLLDSYPIEDLNTFLRAAAYRGSLFVVEYLTAQKLKAG